MRKYFACLLTALLLLAALMVPAFAEPDDVETAVEETTVATAEEETGEDPAEEQTFIAVMLTEPETTLGIVPIDAELLLLDGADEGLLSQRNITLVALCFSGLALVLSIVALARTRKKTSPNATGNYQKYF